MYLGPFKKLSALAHGKKTRDIDEMRDVFGDEPWPYGVEPNRRTLEALMTYLVDQSIIATPIPVDDLFVPTFS